VSQQPFSETVPPQLIEAEKSVLGALLLDRGTIPVVRTELDPEDFYYDRHGQLYRSILTLYDRNQPIDLITLQTLPNLDEMGGVLYLTSLMNSTTTTANVQAHARIVRRKAQLRRLKYAGLAIAALAQDADQSPEDLDEVVAKATAEAEAKLRSTAVADRSGGLQRIQGIKERAREQLDRMGQKDPNRIEFGLSVFDQFAWLKGEEVAIHGPSGNGKSTLARALLTGAAKKGHAGAYFSLEMGQRNVESCFIAAEGRISLKRIRNMDRDPLTPQEQADYLAAADRLDQLPIYADYIPFQRMQDIRAKALRAKAQYGELDLVVIDYAGILGDSPQSWQRHEQMLVRLHYEGQWLAKELGALVIMVDQAPMEMLSRPNPTPTIQDFREAKGIVQALDHAIGCVIPANCIPTEGRKGEPLKPTFPCPDGVMLPYNDRRLENVLMCAYTKGRFTGGGYLLPVYLDKPSGFIGNLDKMPWKLPDGQAVSGGLPTPVPAPSSSRPPGPEPKDEF
jgi:replicative DNA helicase